LLTFNNDIQGTAAVALGAILAAVKVSGSGLKNQQVVMLGAGSAGIGIADFLRVAMRANGLSDTDTMILAAARALAENSPALRDATASLLPALTDLRQVAVQIAIAVGREAQSADIASKGTEAELRQRVISTQWTPAYPSPG
jgi:malic enzyme